MPESKIRDRLVGGWRLMGYEVTADGKTEHSTTTQTISWAREQPR